MDGLAGERSGRQVRGGYLVIFRHDRRWRKIICYAKYYHRAFPCYIFSSSGFWLSKKTVSQCLASTDLASTNCQWTRLHDQIRWQCWVCPSSFGAIVTCGIWGNLCGYARVNRFWLSFCTRLSATLVKLKQVPNLLRNGLADCAMSFDYRGYVLIVTQSRSLHDESIM